MRIALLSDIHANIQALDACLAHARAQQAERFVFLGDMVGYGADPGAVVERIMRLTEEGAMAIQGNHDAMAIQPPAEVRTVEGPGGFSPVTFVRVPVRKAVKVGWGVAAQRAATKRSGRRR